MYLKSEKMVLILWVPKHKRGASVCVCEKLGYPLAQPVKSLETGFPSEDDKGQDEL